MSNDIYKSTNQVTKIINPDEGVILRGELTFAVTSPEGSYFFGVGSVEIEWLNQTVVNPTVEVYRYIEYGAPGFQEEFVKSPYTLFNAATMQYADNVVLGWDLRNLTQLFVTARSISSIAEVRYFYVIKATSITTSLTFGP